MAPTSFRLLSRGPLLLVAVALASCAPLPTGTPLSQAVAALQVAGLLA